MMLLAVQNAPAFLLILFLVGIALGSLVNWAIYRLAWHQRTISPWGPAPADGQPRTWRDRLPIIGWWGLRREESIHGRWFWLRPMAIELSMGIGLAALWWWEVASRGLVVGLLEQQLEFQAGLIMAIPPETFPTTLLWPTYINHVILIVLMAAASFIDLDEKIIPDEITVPGTLLGLLLATFMPWGLLPNVALRQVPPPIGKSLELPPAAEGINAYLEPMTLAAPNIWTAELGGFPRWESLLLAQACWWLWCFALAPRVWRGRRGVFRGATVILRRVLREFTRPPLGAIAIAGALAIAAVWWWGGHAWIGLLTALVGMVISGGLVWIVRLVGTAALQREAMGFGDVTLMMMMGTFLGWQACVVVFFVAPFAGLLAGILQAVTKHDDVIPYGPFLCLGALFVMVWWAAVWSYIDFAFEWGWLVLMVLLVCFALMGIMLAVWQQIKRMLFS